MGHGTNTEVYQAFLVIPVGVQFIVRTADLSARGAHRRAIGR